MSGLINYAGTVPLLLALSVAAGAQPYGDYLVTLPVEGGSTPRVLIQEPGRSCGSPRWSPDGQWVAYDTIPSKYKGGVEKRFVRVVRADGEADRTVGDGGMPSWSPDGRDLVWHTYERPSAVVARNDGSSREEIASNWSNPVWLRRDPRRVVLLRYGIFNLGDLKTGRTDRVLAVPEGVVRGYSVSPDGSRVAYVNGLKQLCVAELVAGGSERVLVAQGISDYVSWAPEGDRLVFSWREDYSKLRQLHIIASGGDAAEPQRVPGQEADAENMNPDWSPDGKTIVYRRSRPVVGS